MRFTREELDYIKKFCVYLQTSGLSTKYESACRGMFSKSQAMVRDGGKAYDEKGFLKAEYAWSDEEKKSILFYCPSDSPRTHTK